MNQDVDGIVSARMKEWLLIQSEPLSFERRHAWVTPGAGEQGISSVKRVPIPSALAT